MTDFRFHGGGEGGAIHPETTAIVSMFKMPELKQTAEEVEDTLLRIIKEASI